MVIAISAELQSLVTVTLDGFGTLGVWDTRQGGDPDSTPTVHRPGGMGPQVVYPALPTYSAITVSRVLDNENRTDSSTMALVTPLAGNTMGTITEQPLDSDGNAFGTPSTWRGLLSSVHRGNVDSNSEAARMWELLFTAVTLAN